MNRAFQRLLEKEITVNNVQLPPVLESPQNARVKINGKWKISLCSNNYLGLANHELLVDGVKKACDQYGAGAGAARFLSGNTAIHEKLEGEIARFKDTEAAILFNSGFAANSGVIPAIIGKADAVFSDETNHGSIIDGCRLSAGSKFIYRHADMDHLEELLKKSGDFRIRLVVTDSVFSMDGDIAPLPEMVDLCQQYDAVLMVDEAHATGVLGRHGKGAAEHFGLEGKVDILMGTLGKAMGSLGGYIAGSKELIAYLSRTARTYLLSTALPASSVQAALTGLELLESNSGLRKKLWTNTKMYKQAMINAGFNIMGTKTPIVPIFIGDDDVAAQFSRRLFEEGVYATKIGMPLVPKGTSRIRTIISAAHTEKDIREAVAIFHKVGREFGVCTVA